MKILSLDCSGAWCGVCVWADGEIAALAEDKMDRGQDARLMPMVQQVVKQSGLALSLMDRIAVSRGPGSFTGIRIALAAARGLGLALQKDVVGLDRFAFHRFQQDPKGEKELMVVLQSRREELYTRFFGQRGGAEEPCLLTPLQIHEFVKAHPQTMIAGDAFDSLDMIDPQHFLKPTAPECVTCACLADEVLQDPLLYLPRPFYLRPPDVTIKEEARQEACV